MVACLVSGFDGHIYNRSVVAVGKNLFYPYNLPYYLSIGLVNRGGYVSGILVHKSWRFQETIAYDAHMDNNLCSRIFYLYGQSVRNPSDVYAVIITDFEAV